MFSIADINNAGPSEDFLAEGEETEEDDIAPSFPVRASITVEKVTYKSEVVNEDNSNER